MFPYLKRPDNGNYGFREHLKRSKLYSEKEITETMQKFHRLKHSRIPSGISHYRSNPHQF